MTYEIWQMADDGTAALIEELRHDEREIFQDLGCRQLKTIEADSKTEAQDRFIDWCREQVPNARETPVDQSAIRAELARALAMN